MKRQLIEARIFKINEKYRTLTPIEAERLNGFPDNWTDTMPDRMRYFYGKCSSSSYRYKDWQSN